MRSRASSLPLACWRSTERSEPAWSASSLRVASSESRSVMGWSDMAATLPRSREGVAMRPIRLGSSAVQLPVMPPVAPMLAKATDSVPDGDAWQFEPKWDGFRCIVFRDGPEIELGSRNETAAHAVLPRAGHGLAAGAPRPVRGRRGDRGRDRRRARLRRPPAAHPPGRVEGEQAGARDAFQLRGLRPARPRRRGPHGPAAAPSAGPGSRQPSARSRPPSTSRRSPPTAPRPRTGSCGSRAPGSTG